MYLNIDAQKEMTYDAIVVGSGISGGWAAKELTEKGLRVLCLERGRDIKHVEGYETAMKAPWELPHRGRPDNQSAEEYWAGIRTGYTVNEEHRYLFENDSQNPYLETRPFDWIRAYHTGGVHCCGGVRATVGMKKILWPMPKKEFRLIGQFDIKTLRRGTIT